MLCQPLSIYPDGIDELTFFQDVSLDKIEVLNTYNNLIEQGEYSKASVYINEQEGIFGYFACFFNLIENRIYALQHYLLAQGQKENPIVTTSDTDDDTEITSVNDDTIWI